MKNSRGSKKVKMIKILFFLNVFLSILCFLGYAQGNQKGKEIDWHQKYLQCKKQLDATVEECGKCWLQCNEAVKIPMN